MSDVSRAMEAATLYEQVLCILEFCVEVDPTFSRLADQVRAVAAPAYERGSARQLRYVLREIQEIAQAMPKSRIRELEQRLTDRFGAQYVRERSAEHESRRRWITKLLGRGTVVSERERQRVERYLDDLPVEDDTASERAALLEVLQRNNG
jgi:hypothetical protein